MKKDYDQVKKLSEILDSKYQGPLGVKFGWDAILGLIPGLGDVITSGFSFYIILTASRLGVDSATLLRMGINLLIDNLIDMIPFIGNLFDFYWKANNKNIILMEKALERPEQESIKSRMVLTLVAIMLISFLALSIYGAIKLMQYVYHLIIT